MGSEVSSEGNKMMKARPAAEGGTTFTSFRLLLCGYRAIAPLEEPILVEGFALAKGRDLCRQCSAAVYRLYE